MMRSFREKLQKLAGKHDEHPPPGPNPAVRQLNGHARPPTQPAPQQNFRTPNHLRRSSRPVSRLVSNLPSRVLPPPKKIDAQDLRELCELIKERHGLDVVLNGWQDVRLPDRPFVEEQMRKADAILARIENIVRVYAHPAAFEKTEDYNKFMEIKNLVAMSGKRNWTKYPPWMD
jgi:hypothetical protein